MKQNEIWIINLDPVSGAEIKKSRPAVIVNDDSLKLRKTGFTSFPNVFIGNPSVEFKPKAWIPAFAGMTLLWFCP